MILYQERAKMVSRVLEPTSSGIVKGMKVDTSTPDGVLCCQGNVCSAVVVCSLCTVIALIINDACLFAAVAHDPHWLLNAEQRDRAESG